MLAAACQRALKVLFTFFARLRALLALARQLYTWLLPTSAAIAARNIAFAHSSSRGRATAETGMTLP